MLQFAGFAVEILIVVIIIFFQVHYFIINGRKRKILSSIFPKDSKEHFETERNEEGVPQIIMKGYENDVLDEEIVKPVNSYLKENKGATDYHIIKDLTDRSCDKVQEEVDSYNPIPLYLGLCGTMLGIIVGIIFLCLGGGLDSLLASASSAASESDTASITAAARDATKAASQGIQHLLGGVAIAMVASFVGVIMTILGTKRTKSAVADNEEGRNRFLSWIQCNLLPQMSSDVVSTLGVFYSNLNNFNSIFSQNSRELKCAFEQIQKAYQGQTEYARELNKLDIDKAQLAFASLGTATQRINDLNVFLRDSSTYISKIIELNDKLETADSRTKAVEEMGLFFKNEIEQINVRKTLLSESVGKIDLALKDAINGLQVSSTEYVGNIKEHLSKIYIDFQDAVAEQQRILTEKLAESSNLLSQFKRLEAIENELKKLDMLDNILTALNSLGGRFEELQSTIKTTGASLKGSGDSIAQMNNPSPMEHDMKVTVKMPMPAWLLYVTCSLLLIASIFSIVFPILVKFGVI